MARLPVELKMRLHFGSKDEKSNCARREALGLGKEKSENFTNFLLKPMKLRKV